MSVIDYIPILSGMKSLKEGDPWYKTAAGFTPWAPLATAADRVGGYVKGKIGDAVDSYNGVYDKKAEGYDAVIGELGRLKKERQGQKDYAYNLADSKYAPTRAAIAKVYGDPSGWKL
jgi:hypothetical protein